MTPPTVKRSLLWLAIPLALASSAACAGEVAERVASAHNVRVCIWPDYYGVTFRNPRSQKLGGIDIELAEQFAHDLGAGITLVDSSFPSLVQDLVGDKCDVAMFAIGVLPARQAVLRFSQPYMRSDIYGVTTRSSRQIRSWADIDKPGVQVAVQAGTFMEPVMTAALKNASIVVVKPPMTREAELEAGRVDVFMTDYPYSRRLLDNADWARLVAPSAPFHVLPYAYAVKPGDDAWLKRVDEFVARIKKDGRLEAAARRNGLGEIVITH
jgi:ABC-type amino acid transport substrate-binding protein